MSFVNQLIVVADTAFGLIASFDGLREFCSFTLDYGLFQISCSIISIFIRTSFSNFTLFWVVCF